MFYFHILYQTSYFQIPEIYFLDTALLIGNSCNASKVFADKNELCHGKDAPLFSD